MPKKKRRRYGDYCELIDGQLYGSVNLPLGGNKYRRERRRVGNPTEARQWALARLDEHKSGGMPRKRQMLFADLAAWYSREFIIPPVYKDGKKIEGMRTYRSEQNKLDNISKELGFLKLDAITVDVLRRYKRDRLKKVSITAVNRDLGLLRTMFKKAWRRKWIKENPFDHGESLIEMALEAPREMTITPRIAKRLLARSRKSRQPLLYHFILVMMSVGGRPSEIFPFDSFKTPDVPKEPLCWKNILDFDFKWVKLVSYKGRIRKERFVPTTAHLERELRAWHCRIDPQPEDLLFPVSSFKKAWEGLCRSARIEGVWMRDFRRYFNSMLIRSKTLNDAERMLMMGHVDIETNLIYSHLDPSFVTKYRDAIEISDAVN